jgi:uncharacterized membrane protein YfcA
MIGDLPLGEVAMIFGVLVVTGLVTGFIAGLLGAGGGGLLTPVLYEVFGLLSVPDESRMHLAVGTSLAVMVPTTLRSYAAHKGRGGTDTAIVKRLAFPIFLGVLFGSLVAGWISSDGLKWIWVIFGLILVTKLLIGRDSWRLGDDVPNSFLVECYGVAVGTVSTLMSVGGGAYITALLTIYGRPIQQAVGTASGLAPVVVIPGMIGLIWAGWDVQGLPIGSIGYVNMLGFAAIVPTSVLMAPVGARLAHGFSRYQLETIMGLFILTISIRFLVSILLGV